MKIYEAVDKRFLSMRPSEGGSISWDVEAHLGRRKGNTTIAADMKITDCFKQISLDFYSTSPALFKQRIDKIDNLMESLEAFKISLHEARLKSVEAILQFREKNRGIRFLEKKGSKKDCCCEDCS